MNKMKFMVLFMSIAMIFGSCGSMNNTGKGAAIGGGSGAALGAILGGVIGKGKGAGDDDEKRSFHHVDVIADTAVTVHQRMAQGFGTETEGGRGDRKSTRLNSSH